MPDAGGMMTPLKAIWRAGFAIQTEDMAGQRANVCVGANDAQAEWVAYSLAMYHRVPYYTAGNDGTPELQADSATLTTEAARLRAATEEAEGSPAESPG